MAIYRKRYARVIGSTACPSIRIVVTFTNHRFASLLLAWLTSLRKNDYQSFCTRSPSSGSQEKRPFSNGLFSIQSEGLVWNHPQGVWNPSQSDGMAYSLLAHRLHGGTSCYVPSLTERSRSNLHSLADKQACRLASLDYHASACISPSD